MEYLSKNESFGPFRQGDFKKEWVMGGGELANFGGNGRKSAIPQRLV